MARRYSKKSSKKSTGSFLPAVVHEFLARRIFDLWALGIIALGLFSLVAMLSYESGDPSLNTGLSASGVDVQNFAGLYGAYLSDFFMQTLGVSSLFLPVLLIFWGVRLFKRYPFYSLGLRLSTLLVLLLTGAVFFARVPAFEGWPLGAYLGGSAGTLVFNQLTAWSEPVVGRFSHWFISSVAFISMFLSFAYASHVSFASWKALGANIVRLLAICLLFVLHAIRSFVSWVKRHGVGSDNEIEQTKGWIAKWLDAREEAVKAKASAPRIEPSMAKALTNPQKTEPSSVPEKRMDTVSKKEVTVAQNTKPAVLEADDQPMAVQTLASGQEWSLPPLDLLQVAQVSDSAMTTEELQDQAERLQSVLEDFGVKGDIVKVHPGPVVTLYELEPAPGTKSSRIISLSDDIARSMEAVSVRAAVIPGKNAIGIEVPNEQREIVYLREILASKAYTGTKCKLPLVLGKDIGGHPVIADLGKMPHLLVAGTTGSGKSVAVNTMILSLVYHMSPEKCRFIMIDPKMLELSIYDGIPHLLTPVVTEPGKAVVALKWAVKEMEDRYRAMSKLGVRNIDGYNARIRQAIEKGEVLTRRIQTGFDADTGKPVFEEQPIDLVELPYIVIIVDEFADLMMVAGKDVEAAIQRLAQMARAAGLHLIMATQRPSVDVITGTIKANFPTRVSFQVTSKVDSRTILGEGGAEQLLGMGDMLYMAAGGKVRRVHGPFASDDEVDKVVRFLKSQGEPDYIESVTDGDNGGDMLGLFDEGDNQTDELYDHAVAIVASEQKASTSFIQRRLQIGYNRAANIVEQMEKQGVIGPANHVGKREILIAER